MNLQINRPEPISNVAVFPYHRKVDVEVAIQALLDGEYVLIADYYSSGLSLLRELKRQIEAQNKSTSFQGQRNTRLIYKEFSNRILLDIADNKLTVKKAPEIGWLKILYPDISDFALPFPKIQGLNSAWQWYKKGVFIPVLKKKIFPYYGNYFPTRFEHLELFEDWLKGYKGAKESAIDIGIGSGILSFQMLDHWFEKVIGTDSNPNAIVGLREAIKGSEQSNNLHLIHGDLFAGHTTPTELIVFNPPWLPAKHDTEGMDKAIYYDADLFPNFFEAAKKMLKPEGKLVLLFSNLAQITKVSKSHPIEEELAKGGRFKKELLVKKSVKSASKKTKRNQNWRLSEQVELWVLVHR